DGIRDATVTGVQTCALPILATGLEAIRRARHPEAKTELVGKPIAKRATPAVSFAGDLSLISMFDAVQAIENSRLTGVLTLTNEKIGRASCREREKRSVHRGK